MPRKEDKFREITQNEHCLRRACCNIFIFAKDVNIFCNRPLPMSTNQ